MFLCKPCFEMIRELGRSKDRSRKGRPCTARSNKMINKMIFVEHWFNINIDLYINNMLVPDFEEMIKDCKDQHLTFHVLQGGENHHQKVKENCSCSPNTYLQ